MIKQKINNFITKQVGTRNGSNRDEWLEKTLSRLPKNTTILDAGAGEGKYKKFCTHLDYKSQDIAEYDGEGDGKGLHTKTRDYNNLDFVSDITNMPIEDEYFDSVLCVEVLEHVPDPAMLVSTCLKLLKPNGHLFLSTINKNPRSFITAIVGAEYIFNILPKGTHEFNKFIKPSKLAEYIRKADGKLIESKGMFYNPLTHKANLNNDLGVNYMMYARKIED